MSLTAWEVSILAAVGEFSARAEEQEVEKQEGPGEPGPYK